MAIDPEPTVTELLRYNQWANQQLLSVCMGIGDDVIKADIAGGYGSIVATFVHILRAQAGFLKRIHGVAPHMPMGWDENPGLAQLAALEGDLSSQLLSALQHVSMTQNLHEEGPGWTFDYQARLVFMSVVYHGVAHRTDITTYLNGRGITVPELDVWAYQFANPERFDGSFRKTDD